MDIIISAKQSARKTATALAMIKTYYGLADVSAVVEKTYHVTRPGAKPVPFDVRTLTLGLISAALPCVLFDGCLHTPKDMADAVNAVRQYRLAAPDRDILAVYVECHPEALVILQDEYNKPQGYSEAIHDVIKECEAQDTRFGSDRVQSLLKWFSIYNEEVLEFTREVVAHAISEDPAEKVELLERAREELVQAAAVSIQVLKSFFYRKDMIVAPELTEEQKNEFKTAFREADKVKPTASPVKEKRGTINGALNENSAQFERMRAITTHAITRGKGADVAELLAKYGGGVKRLHALNVRHYDAVEGALIQYRDNDYALPGKIGDDGRRLLVTTDGGKTIIFEGLHEEDGIQYPDLHLNTHYFTTGKTPCSGFNHYLVLNAKPEHRFEYFKLLNATPYEI